MVEGGPIEGENNFAISVENSLKELRREFAEYDPKKPNKKSMHFLSPRLAYKLRATLGDETPSAETPLSNIL